LIVGLIIFSQVLSSTATAATEMMTDMELEDKAIKQELEPSETEEIEDEKEEDNTLKQEEEEEQESNDDTIGTGLEEDNIMIDIFLGPSLSILFYVVYILCHIKGSKIYIIKENISLRLFFFIFSYVPIYEISFQTYTIR
jgi:hypothetical protein